MFALSYEVSKKFIIFAPEHCFFVALRNYALCHIQLWAQGDGVIFEGIKLALAIIQTFRNLQVERTRYEIMDTLTGISGRFPVFIS